MKNSTKYISILGIFTIIVLRIIHKQLASNNNANLILMHENTLVTG